MQKPSSPQPTKLPPDRQPQRARPVVRFERRGDMRLAFEIERGGSYVKRVAATGPFNLSTEVAWWTDCGNEASATVLDDRLHIEVTPGLMDGSADAVGKLARFLGVDASSFAAMYVRLLTMLQPRLAD